MRRRWLFGVAAIPVLIGLLHQAGRGDETGSPAAARTPATCDRIISLAPSITESLFAVGLGDRVVGVTRYCAFPKAVADIPKIGGYADPSLQSIVALDPTLVVMHTEHWDTRDKLEKLGIATLSVSQHRVSDILHTMTALGQACGTEDRANETVSALRARVDRISRRVAGRPRPSVMISMGRNMGSGGLKDAYIAGEESYYQDLIQFAGGRNAYSGRVPFPVVSREGMLGLNPEVIIDMVPDLREKGWTVETVRAEWQGLKVRAVADNRVYVFMDADSVVPGPRFILTLEKMARALHPEIAWDAK